MCTQFFIAEKAGLWLPLMWTLTRNQFVELCSPLLSCYLLWGFFFSSIECSSTYLVYWRWSWGYIEFLFTEICIFFVFQILSPISSPVEFPQYIPKEQIFPRMTHWDIPQFLSGPSGIPRQGRGCGAGAGHNRRPFLPLKVTLRLLKLSASQCYRSNQALSDWI